MSEQEARLPLTYRAELLTRVLPKLRAGESCALIGTSGVGKSNLLQFLRRTDLHRHYWGDAPVWFVTLDTHSLVYADRPDTFVAAELLIHRLIIEAERQGAPAELVAWADGMHARLVTSRNDLEAIRQLERLCLRLTAGAGPQLVFVFDQFDDLWREAPARFFLNLRHLRDELKYRLVYLVLTRERITRLRDDLDAVEAFWELFSAHTYGLGMYSAGDAQVMVERIAQRRGMAIPPALSEAALWVSGRHPGLLRAVLWLLLDSPDGPAPPPADLLRHGAVVEECAKIWNDLPLEEQQVLRDVAAGASPATGEVLADLRLKGLVTGDPPAIFGPVFQAFVKLQGGETGGVVVDTRTRRVWIEGQPLGRRLTRLEFTLLVALARRAGQVCSWDSLAEQLYPDEAADSDNQRVETVLRRLRSALNDDARSPRYLITHRGEGVQLAAGGVRS